MFSRGKRKIYYLFPGTAWHAGCQIWWDPRDCSAVSEQQSHHLISCFIHFDFTKAAWKDSVPSWQCDLVPWKWGGTEKEKKHNKTFGILLSSALPIKTDDEKMTQLTLGDSSERPGGNLDEWIYCCFLFPLNTNCKKKINQSAYITSRINQIVSKE